MSRLCFAGGPLLLLVLVAYGCEATRPTRPVMSGPTPRPKVFLARGGMLGFSDNLAMVFDGVMVPDSASALVIGLRVGSGPLFPRGTLTAQEASLACGVDRPVAFLQTTPGPMTYSSSVPDTCRPPE